MTIGTRPPIDSLYHYYCEFNARGVIAHFQSDDLRATPDVTTNFIGTRIAPKIHPHDLEPLVGTIEGPPDPGDWHADIAEWAAALRTVRQARDTYRIVELGCGWGCWLTNMGVAARHEGLRVDLLHVDIQGAKVDYLRGNFGGVGTYVKRVLIGTHSRSIEGALMDLFLTADWRLEMERPALTPLRGGRPKTTIDGVQMWANPAFLA